VFHEVPAPSMEVLQALLAKIITRLMVAGIGRELENTGDHVEAVKFYERGIDTDNMTEAFYQGSMRCHAAAGRAAEVTPTYLRLKQLLSITLNVKPSAATERLYQSLRGG
jgi:LuxR family maltose regulon positive regulatory protein